MSKEKEVVRFRVARFSSDAEPYTVTADNAQQEVRCEMDRRFMYWLTDWQESEIPE